jgi:hypothetical protein
MPVHIVIMWRLVVQVTVAVLNIIELVTVVVVVGIIIQGQPVKMYTPIPDIL